MVEVGCSAIFLRSLRLRQFRASVGSGTMGFGCFSGSGWAQATTGGDETSGQHLARNRRFRTRAGESERDDGCDCGGGVAEETAVAPAGSEAIA